MQAVTLCQQMIQIIERDGFNLTKFKSNSDRVLKALPDDKYDKATQGTRQTQDTR